MMSLFNLISISKDIEVVSMQSGGHLAMPHGSSGFEGQLRYYNQKIQIYDGGSWHNFPEVSFSVDLNNDIKQTLSWAKQKMQEEKKREALAMKNPAVSIAYENFKKSEEALNTVCILADNNSN
jgi:hypothetical protein